MCLENGGEKCRASFPKTHRDVLKSWVLPRQIVDDQLKVYYLFINHCSSTIHCLLARPLHRLLIVMNKEEYTVLFVGSRLWCIFTDYFVSVYPARCTRLECSRRTRWRHKQ